MTRSPARASPPICGVGVLGHGKAHRAGWGEDGERLRVLERSAESVIYRGGEIGGKTRVTYRVWDPWQVVQLDPA